MATASSKLPELLAPAGDFAAACAAIRYGADAVYVGLPRFSARAEAVNFSPERLRQAVAWAHAQQPLRRVYATFNTLVQERELAEAADALELLVDAGVDALIVQDLGIHSLVRRSFPKLRLHASTQLAVHNLDGARALADLGFSRVVLARELTLDEVAGIVGEAGLEVEVFLHGALCYSYSGLCLFSAHETGRSGNRGRCAYCCREAFAVPGNERDTRRMPFSMRDLALAPLLDDLVRAGVASLKIEGRMKNALYVACVTDYYRRKLDGALDAPTEAALVEDLQTVFSRPWTTLYAAGADAAPGTIIDPHAVGHRGAAIGVVDGVRCESSGRWLRFHTRRAIEKHDGLQLDPPRGGKPFGFAVTALRRAGSRRTEVGLPAGTMIEAPLPPDAPPDITVGATVYCAASQAVRRCFDISLPRPTACRAAHAATIAIEIRPDGCRFTAAAAPVRPDLPPLAAIHNVAATLALATHADRTPAACERAFARSGETPWQVSAVNVRDPQGLYAPPSLLNEARRALLDALTAAREEQRDVVRAEVREACRAAPAAAGRAAGVPPPRWSAKVALAGPVHAALAAADEVILQIGHLPPDERRARLDAWLALVPRNRLRLALPLIARDREVAARRRDLATLVAQGWTRWEAADLASLHLLCHSLPAPVDLTADWSCYGLNHLARDLLASFGVARAVTSPEDTAENLAALAAAAGPAVETLVVQHTPLFIAETAPCAGWTDAGATHTLAGSRGRRFLVHRVDGRWITVSAAPFCLADRAAALARAGVAWYRVDLSWSPPETIRFPACWDGLRAGRAPAGSHAANFDRGLA